jgi:hypothetical protein
MASNHESASFIVFVPMQIILPHLSAEEQKLHQTLLVMETIFASSPTTTLAHEHLGGHIFASMSGQARHDDST